MTGAVKEKAHFVNLVHVINVHWNSASTSRKKGL